MTLLVGYLPGPPVAGFYGMFEENYGKPEDGPLSTIVPSTEKGTILPFSCPACDRAIDFRSKWTREKFHDTRRGTDQNGFHVRRDNYFCPSCGYRFKLRFDGKPLKTAIYGKAVAPSEVIDADGTVSRRDQMTFIGAMMDRVCRVVDVIGAGGIVQSPLRNPFQTKSLTGKTDKTGKIGGAGVSPAKAAVLTKTLATGDRLIAKGLRIQKKKGGKGIKFGKSVEKLGRKMVATARKAEAELKKQAGKGGTLQRGRKAEDLVKPLPIETVPSAALRAPKPAAPVLPRMVQAPKRSMPKLTVPRAPLQRGATKRIVLGAYGRPDRRDGKVVTPDERGPWVDTESSGSMADTFTSQAERLDVLGTVVDEISTLAGEMFDLYELLPPSATKLINDGNTYLQFLGTLADKIDAAILVGNDQATIDGYNYISYNWNTMFKGWIQDWLKQAQFVINRFGFDPNTVSTRMGPALTSLKAAIEHANKSAATAAKINAELAQAATDAAASAQTILDEGLQSQSEGAAFNINDWIKRATEAATTTEAAAKACDVAVANYKPDTNTNTNTNTNDGPPGGDGFNGPPGSDGFSGPPGGGFGDDYGFDPNAESFDESGVPTPPTYGGNVFSESHTTPEIPDGYGGFIPQIDGPSWSEAPENAYASSPLEEWSEEMTFDHSEPLVPFEDESFVESEMEFPAVDDSALDMTDMADQTEVTEEAQMVVGHHRHWSRHLDR